MRLSFCFDALFRFRFAYVFLIFWSSGIRKARTMAMSGPRPEARQVRMQLACRGSAVRSIAWFAQSSC